MRESVEALRFIGARLAIQYCVGLHFYSPACSGGMESIRDRSFSMRLRKDCAVSRSYKLGFRSSNLRNSVVPHCTTADSPLERRDAVRGSPQRTPNSPRI